MYDSVRPSGTATTFRTRIATALTLLSVVAGTVVGMPSSAASGLDSASAGGVASISPSTNVRRIVFGEQKIEGKILRPQLVLIKADQRPEFLPMVVQTPGKKRNIAGLVDESLIEAPHKGAFQFKGTSIITPEP